MDVMVLQAPGSHGRGIAGRVGSIDQELGSKVRCALAGVLSQCAERSQKPARDRRIAREYRADASHGGQADESCKLQRGRAFDA